MRKHREEASAFAVIVAICAALSAAPAAAVDDLILNVAPGSETVAPGDTLVVTLDVANLTAAINGVQALMWYDVSILSLVDIVPTDLGLTPPAQGWVEVTFTDDLGGITYAAVINGSSSIVNGTVATLTFDVIGEGFTNVSFQQDSPPFLSKLTVAADNSTLLPTKIRTVAITSTCDDGLYCNGAETFDGLNCQPGAPPDCTALTNQCNDASCDEVNDQCVAAATNEGLACDDGDLCTVGDTCLSGVCETTPVDCSSLDDTCNVGTCDPADGSCIVVPANEGGSCDDAVFCNGVDTCSSGVCVSAGDPCDPLFCDEVDDVCLAPGQVAGLEVFYAGRFLDQPNPSKGFLAVGEVATPDNITNHIYGITGVRVIFNSIVDFATTPDAAFTFEWTTGSGSTFTAMTGVATAVAVTTSVVSNATVVDVVIADHHVRRRWLKVTIDATQVTTAGIELDGELFGAPMVFPSGDGSPGGDAVFFLGNQPGDVTGDRKTLLTDVVLIRAAVNPFFGVPITNLYDVDKDEKVLLADVGLARIDVNPFFTLPLIAP